MKKTSGYLELFERKYGFLRDIENNFKPGTDDIFVPPDLIYKHNLQEGVYLEGTAVENEIEKGNLKLDQIEKINRRAVEEYTKIVSLKDVVSISPSERLLISQGPGDVMGKALDIIVPIGKGQRGLIIAPPKSGKTTILKHMARSIILNHPDVSVFVLLVDERPEEVTDFRRALKKAHVLSSSADESISQHLRMTRLTINIATRVAEAGGDAVVFIDSLTRLSRAFNADTRSYGRTLTGGLGANAMEMPRRIFGAARNIDNGGSLSILATILIDTGSRMDDVIYQEFVGTGNMDLVLSQRCAELRLWPAIDIQQSGTRKEHLLLTQEEYDEMVSLRRALSGKTETDAMAALIEYLR